ncbi:hypothetical protein KIPB_005263, partial [Kipferlia bialata]|eukprot:g5263.t1
MVKAGTVPGVPGFTLSGK